MVFRAEPSVRGRLEASLAAGASRSTGWGQLFVEVSPSAGAAGRCLAQFGERGVAVGEEWIWCRERHASVWCTGIWVKDLSSLARCPSPGAEPAHLSHRDANLNTSWWFTK